MKKLLFIAVFGLGNLTASAQVTDPQQRPTADPTQQETADPIRQETTDPTEQETIIDPTQQQRTVEPAQRPTSDPDRQTAERETAVQDGYSEITMKELPGSVKKAVKMNYQKAKINKVYTNEQGQYKLEVSRRTVPPKRCSWTRKESL